MKKLILIFLSIFLLISFANASSKKGYGGVDAATEEWTAFATPMINSGFETGTTSGWGYGSLVDVTDAEAHSGTYSLHGSGGNFTLRQLNINITSIGSKISAWVKPATGATGTITFYSYAHIGGATLAAGAISGTVGTTLTAGIWNELVLNVKYGDVIPGIVMELRITTSGITGDWYVDDAQIIPYWPLIRTFVKYPNYRGFVWVDLSQNANGVVKAYAPEGETLSDYKAVLKFYKVVAEGDTLEQTTTISTFDADNEGTFTFDMTSYSNDDEILIKSELQDKATSSTAATFVDWRIVKKAASHRTALERYIDSDNFLVVGGQRKFIIGVYDRWSGSYRCTGCIWANQSQYETQVAGFDSKQTIQNYSDSKIDLLISILPGAALNPGYGASSQWDNPATKDATVNHIDALSGAMNGINSGYLQITNQYYAGAPYRPSWASGLTDDQLWTVTTTYPSSTGMWGYYMADEPDLWNIGWTELQTQYHNYDIIRQNDPDGLAFVCMIGSSERWREIADVVSQDPYIYRGLGALDYYLGDTTIPYGGSVKYAVDAMSRYYYSSRPIWPVLQLYQYSTYYPTAFDLKSMAWASIVRGATGLWWWGFVSSVGMEDRWYVEEDYQAYYDFRDLMINIKGIESALITEDQSWRASCDNSDIDYAVKKIDGTYYLIASNSKEAAQNGVSCTIDNPIKGLVSVYTESRTLTPSEDTFTDDFQGYEAHVYIMEMGILSHKFSGSISGGGGVLK